MRDVKVSKNELIKVVTKNRDNHRTEFEKSIAEYREAVVSYLDEKIEEIKKGGLISHYINLPQPSDHTDDYNQVLEMLNMSVDKDVTLTFGEFRQYVQDDWGWKGDFETAGATLSTYNATKKVR